MPAPIRQDPNPADLWCGAGGQPRYHYIQRDICTKTLSHLPPSAKVWTKMNIRWCSRTRFLKGDIATPIKSSSRVTSIVCHLICHAKTLEKACHQAHSHPRSHLLYPPQQHHESEHPAGGRTATLHPQRQRGSFTSSAIRPQLILHDILEHQRKSPILSRAARSQMEGETGI